MRRLAGGSTKRLKRDEGYTLTEIVVVMAIIGLIVAFLTPGLIGQLGRARAKTAQMHLDSVAASVEMFRSDVGRYPSAGEGLQSLVSEPAGVDGWTGPYLKNPKLLSDPWGHLVQYTVAPDGQSFTVMSFGRDGAPNGTGLDKDLTAPAQ